MDSFHLLSFIWQSVDSFYLLLFIGQSVDSFHLLSFIWQSVDSFYLLLFIGQSGQFSFIIIYLTVCRQFLFIIIYRTVCGQFSFIIIYLTVCGQFLFIIIYWTVWTVFIYYHLSESLLLGVYPEHLRMSCVLLNSAFFLTFCVYPSYFSFHNASRQLSFTFLCLLSTLFHGYGGIRELKELSISVLVFCLLLFSPCISWLCKTWILAFSWTIAARPYKFCMVIASICVMVTTCILRNFILFSHLCVISCPGKNHIFKSDIYI